MLHPLPLPFLPQGKGQQDSGDSDADKSDAFDRKQLKRQASRAWGDVDKPDGARRSGRAGRARVSYVEPDPDDEDDEKEEADEGEEEASEGSGDEQAGAPEHRRSSAGYVQHCNMMICASTIKAGGLVTLKFCMISICHPGQPIRSARLPPHLGGRYGRPVGQ